MMVVLVMQCSHDNNLCLMFAFIKIAIKIVEEKVYMVSFSVFSH